MGIFSKLFGPPSRNKFARMILRRLRQSGVTGDLKYNPQSFSIGDDRRQFNLSNAYAEYCRAERANREELIGLYLRSWSNLSFELPKDFEDAKPDLMPVVRARSYYEVDLKRGNPDADSSIYPYEIITDDLCVGVVYDLPGSMMTVTQEVLDGWGVSLYEALEAAKENLRETTKMYAKLGSLYSVMHGDAYDATRIVFAPAISAASAVMTMAAGMTGAVGARWRIDTGGPMLDAGRRDCAAASIISAAGKKRFS